MRESNSGDTIIISDTYKHVSYSLNYNGYDAKSSNDLMDNNINETIQLSNKGDNKASLILIECQYDKEMIYPLLSVLPSMLPELSAKSDVRFEVIDLEAKLLTLESQHERMGRTAVINHWASII